VAQAVAVQAVMPTVQELVLEVPPVLLILVAAAVATVLAQTVMLADQAL
jgi:hypothetical protein